MSKTKGKVKKQSKNILSDATHPGGAGEQIFLETFDNVLRIPEIEITRTIKNWNDGSTAVYVLKLADITLAEIKQICGYLGAIFNGR